MDALLGVTTTRELYLEQNGAPLTGATLTYTLVGPSGTTLVSAASATEDGSGWYSYSIDGSSYLATAGRYAEVWSGSSGSLDLYRSSGFLCGPPDGPLVTLAQLRQQLAQVAGSVNGKDFVLGTTSSATGTTLADPDRSEPNDHWRGSWLYLYGGTGRTQSRKVSASTQSSTSLTVSRAWTTTPDSTSLYELHPYWSAADYLRAINWALQYAVRHTALTVVDETLTETTGTYEYTLPAGLHSLAEVWHRDTTSSSNDWQPVSYKDKEWSVVPGRRLLRLPAAATNYRLRLVGQMRIDLLQHDQSYCPVDPAWVTVKAAQFLWMGRMNSPQTDRDAAITRVQAFEAEAKAIAPDDPVLAGSQRL